MAIIHWNSEIAKNINTRQDAEKKRIVDYFIIIERQSSKVEYVLKLVFRYFYDKPHCMVTFAYREKLLTRNNYFTKYLLISTSESLCELQDAIVANTFGRSRSCFLYDVRPSCLCIQYREYSFGVAWTSDRLQQYWSKILFGSLMQCYWSSRCGFQMLLIVRPVRALRLPIVLFKQRTQSFFTSGSTWIITDQTCDKLERKKIQNGPDP